jgi:glyoxylase-like metal-dependent hydrolase (beta-lactamase superfamily II)
MEEDSMAAPFAGVQAPGIYRHKVGNFEITVLSDGNLPFDADLFAGDKDRADELLNKAYFPRKSTTSVNTWLVNTGKQLVLVDTGGSSHFGPTLGKLPKHLADAGVTPDQIDVVIITHMHPDHVPGLLTADKKALFKNAVVHVGDQEHGFWSSEQIYNSVPQDVKGFFDLARISIKPYADAGTLQMYKDGSSVVPGLTTHTAPGHTPGHSMVRISSNGDELLIWGDIVHNAVLQFPEPERSIVYDADPAMAIASRQRVFDMAATDKLLFAGAHLPFPGLGRAVKAQAGYTYVPLPYVEHI